MQNKIRTFWFGDQYFTHFLRRQVMAISSFMVLLHGRARRISLHTNMSCLADGDGAALDVGEGEVANFACYAVGSVKTRSLALLLDEGVDLPFQETAVGGYLDFHNRGVTRYSRQVHAVRCAEIAEAIGNEASVIDLHATHDMRPVAIDDVGSVVNAEVGKRAQVATVFAQEELMSLGQMGVGTALGSTVEGHDEDVALRAQVVKNGLHGAEVVMMERIAVVAKGAEAIFHAVALDNGRAGAPLDAGILDA